MNHLHWELNKYIVSSVHTAQSRSKFPWCGAILQCIFVS